MIALSAQGCPCLPARGLTFSVAARECGGVGGNEVTETYHCSGKYHVFCSFFDATASLECHLIGDI